MLISAVLFVVISYIMLRFTISAYEIGHTTLNIWWPMWPFYLLATLGSIVLMIRLIRQMKEYLAKTYTKNIKTPDGLNHACD
jgi:TRAP-type C4-dicarboxylate transport system permease small subunit